MVQNLGKPYGKDDLKAEIIAVDSGKYSLKSFRVVNVNDETLTEAFSIRNKLRKINKDTVIIGNNTLRVNYEGETYAFGENGDEPDRDTIKVSFLHKLSVYIAIHHFIKDSKEDAIEVELAVVCPIIQYVNNTLRKNFYDLIYNDGKEITLTVDNIEKTFRIKELKIIPEGYGLLFNDEEGEYDDTIGFIDIGGQNINFVYYNGKTVIDDKCNTTDKGIYSLLDEINTSIKISSDTGFIVKDIENENLEKAILTGGYGKKENIKKLTSPVIDECCVNYIKNIINFIKILNWELAATTLVFCGGGAILLKKYIQSTIPGISDYIDFKIVEDIYANASGAVSYLYSTINNKQ
ncbi:MAG: ParM/StbA family protein [Oscillospiraceae bacterium]|nr:ParM/StbA family protein [Oscillospiraceae bacterium]